MLQRCRVGEIFRYLLFTPRIRTIASSCLWTWSRGRFSCGRNLAASPHFRELECLHFLSEFLKTSEKSKSFWSLSVFHRRLLSILRHLYSSGVFDYCNQEALSTQISPRNSGKFAFSFFSSERVEFLVSIWPYSVRMLSLTMLWLSSVSDKNRSLQLQQGNVTFATEWSGTNSIDDQENSQVASLSMWVQAFLPLLTFWQAAIIAKWLNALVCLPSHLSCWGGSQRNSGLSKTPGANIGERQARDKWHRAPLSFVHFRHRWSRCHSKSVRLHRFPDHQLLISLTSDICGHSQLQGGRIRLLREDDEKRCGWDRQAQKGSLASLANVTLMISIMKSEIWWHSHTIYGTTDWPWIFHVKFLSVLCTRNSL